MKDYCVKKTAISSFTQDVLEKICPLKSPHRYYVYRLIDPRTYQTFYVGKGTGNRVFDHAKAAIRNYEKNQDERSEKISLIQDILSEGKDVICLIHRWGMTENEALEVEAALIDAYSGLTNDQLGHNPERGIIAAEELQKSFSKEEYREPNEKYLIIKTTQDAIKANGSLYEATRRSWKRTLNSVKKYKYVLSVINGIVREVYEVEPHEWLESKAVKGRIEFENEGRTTTNPTFRELVGKRIPATYRQRGMASPVLSSK